MKKENQSGTVERLFVGAETLAGMLDCGRVTAAKIGSDAGARVQYGKCVRYDVAKVKAYLAGLTETQEA